MKKFLVVVGILYGLYWYAEQHWNFDDTLAYAHHNATKSWAPAADYWIGMVYYQRAEYPRSQQALTQLLTDVSTTTYRSKALLRLSEVATENRDYPTARESLETFLQEFPNDKNARIAEGRLEMVKFK